MKNTAAIDKQDGGGGGVRLGKSVSRLYIPLQTYIKLHKDNKYIQEGINIQLRTFVFPLQVI